MSAYEELVEYLEDGELVEGVVFGPYGWPFARNSRFIPMEREGIVMPLSDACQFMDEWHIDGGFGSPECHAMYVWTDRRVIFITGHDGATWLDSVPRHPTDCTPHMPRG